MQAVRRNSFCGSGCAPLSQWRSPWGVAKALMPEAPRLGVLLIWEFLHWYASPGPCCLLLRWLQREVVLLERERSKVRERGQLGDPEEAALLSILLLYMGENWSFPLRKNKKTSPVLLSFIAEALSTKSESQQASFFVHFVHAVFEKPYTIIPR